MSNTPSIVVSKRRLWYYVWEESKGRECARVFGLGDVR